MLAHPSRSQDRHQAHIRIGDKFVQLGQFRLTADEGCGLRWEVVWDHGRFSFIPYLLAGMSENLTHMFPDVFVEFRHTPITRAQFAHLAVNVMSY